MSEMVKLRSYGPSTDTICPYDDDETTWWRGAGRLYVFLWEMQYKCRRLNAGRSLSRKKKHYVSAYLYTQFIWQSWNYSSFGRWVILLGTHFLCTGLLSEPWVGLVHYWRLLGSENAVFHYSDLTSYSSVHFSASNLGLRWSSHYSLQDLLIAMIQLNPKLMSRKKQFHHSLALFEEISHHLPV